VQIFRFGREAGKSIDHFDSNFIMSRILITDKPAHIGCMHLQSNGIIGFHRTVTPQLLLVVQGDGYVRCDSEEKVRIAVGDAVFWEKGEGHETRSESGLTAIVIESEELNPSRFMPKA
jgi:mannose-6-phosphate isomerase-like protein (cupin superfamily)